MAPKRKAGGANQVGAGATRQGEEVEKEKVVEPIKDEIKNPAEAGVEGEKEEEKKRLAEAVADDEKKEESNNDELSQDVEMKVPKEKEQDAPAAKGPKLEGGTTCFNTDDTTLNVMQTAGGRMLTGLNDRGFQYLLAGARANVGIKAGRYAFEAMMVESRTLAEAQPLVHRGALQPVPPPKQLAYVGFSTAGSSLLMDGAGSLHFDSEGYFVHDRDRKKAGTPWRHGQAALLLLNLDPTSPNANTVSLFIDGDRASEPQPLPDAMKDQALYPAVAYRGATLRVNFGPIAMRPLPFTCRMVGDASKADCIVSSPQDPTNGKRQVLFPVGLPDEGTFDWLDQFLAKNKTYTELSHRAIIEWATKSGLRRTKTSRGSNDKPELSFGLPQLDDGSIFVAMATFAPALQRDYVVMEVKGNLVPEDRKATLSLFPAESFNRVAHVVMGEPSREHTAWVQEMLLKDKKAKAEADAKRKKLEADLQKAHDERKKKVLEARKAKAPKKEGEEEAEEKERTEPEEEIQQAAIVELTEDEKKLHFRAKSIPDLSPEELAASFASFSLPLNNEGFDDIAFEWQGEAECKEYITKYVQEKKLTQRVESLQPGEWFKDQFSAWKKTLNEWKKRQQDFKDPAKKKKAKEEEKKRQEERRKAKEAKEKAGEEKEGGGEDEEEEEPKQTDINAEDLDVFAVDDVTDVGNGEPLFANFVYQDWALLSLRFELHLMIHAYKRDLDDPDRPTFHENHLGFYYNKYYNKPFAVSNFGCANVAEVVELIKDTVEINSNSTLASQLSDDTPIDNFVKLAEEHRRDRQRRLDAGDETAELKFAPPRQPPAQGQRMASGAMPGVARTAGQTAYGQKRPLPAAAPPSSYGQHPAKVARPTPYGAAPLVRPRVGYGAGYGSYGGGYGSHGGQGGGYAAGYYRG